MSPLFQLRELNMVEEGDATPYGAILEQCNARRCWNECMALSDFRRRREEINEWNRYRTQRGTIPKLGYRTVLQYQSMGQAWYRSGAYQIWDRLWSLAYESGTVPADLQTSGSWLSFRPVPWSTYIAMGLYSLAMQVWKSGKDCTLRLFR